LILLNLIASFFLNFKVVNVLSHLTDLILHLLDSELAVRVLTRFGFPLRAIVIMCHILIIVDELVTLRRELTSEWLLIECVHDHSVDPSVFSAPASFGAFHVGLCETALAVETRTSFAFNWL